MKKTGNIGRIKLTGGIRAFDRVTGKARLASGVAMAASLFTAGDAFAQQTASVELADNQPSADEIAGGGEIVVTARRRDERLSDVPASAAALTADYLQERGGPRSAKDALAGQAGVRFFDTTSPVNSEVSIRGSSTARATNADPSVGLYRNGAYIGGGLVGGRSFARVDLFDVDRVEVLRGVQGALYGRNAVGGAVNLITMKPQFDNSGYVDLRYTTQTKGKEGQAVLNLSPTEELAFRIGADGIHQNGGFFYNPHNDVYFDRQKGQSYRGQVRYKNDRLDITLLGERQNLDVPAITYRVVIAPGPLFPFGFEQPLYEYNHSTTPYAHQEINTGALSLEYDFDWAKFVSTTLIRQRDSEYIFDADGVTREEAIANFLSGLATFPLSGNSFSFVQDDTQTISELAHLTGSLFEDRVDWLLGVEYLTQKSDGVVYTGTTNAITDAPSRIRAPLSIDYDSYAFFGSLGVDITTRLNLTGEIRYTNDERTATASRFNDLTGVQVGGPAFNFTSGLKSDNISYNATASYKLTDDWLAYVKMGSSYRAGGFNSNLGTAAQPIPIPTSYDDETSTAYEGGLKGQFGDFYIALAGYVSEADNLIVQRDNGCRVTLPACAVAPTSFLTNAGQARTWGVEAEIIASFDVAGGRLTSTLAASRQDGEVTDGPLTGLNTAQTPDWLASANLNFRRDFNSHWGAFANLFVYGQWGGVQELVAISPPLDNYQLVNLRFGVSFDQIEVAAFINNVFDTEYRTFQDFSTTERLGQPRTTGFEARYSF